MAEEVADIARRLKLANHSLQQISEITSLDTAPMWQTRIHYICIECVYLDLYRVITKVGIYIYIYL